MQIIATVTGRRPARVAGLRYNGAFLTGEIKKYEDDFMIMDIPNGRTKISTTKFSDEDLIQICKETGIIPAISYVDTADDIQEGQIAKIETAKALHNMDDIVAKAEMILVDRRDLATAIGIDKVPEACHLITETAHDAGKKVILASEFLLSMVNNSEPTLAEVTNMKWAKDIGADYILLAEETALSVNPQYVIDYANQLCQRL